MALLPKHLSKQGAAFIARFEGFRSTWYRDAVGVRTIGYGHTGPLPPGYTVPLSHLEGLRLLQHDAELAATVVRGIRPRILKQTRFDALVSLAFNLGTGILEPSHDIGRAVRTPFRKNAAAAFLEYDHAGGQVLAGLTKRRQAEARLWKSGQYS